MRRFTLVLALVLLISCVAAVAQEFSRVDVFGGYSYARNQMQGPNAFNFKGWNAEATINGNRFFGVVADFSGHYRLIKAGPVVSTDSDTTIYHFLFGPQVRYRNSNSKASPFARFLIGGSKISVTPQAGGTEFNDTQFTYGFGGGMDVSLTNRVSARLFQADYIRTHFNSTRQNNLRISFGLSFSAGKTK